MGDLDAQALSAWRDAVMEVRIPSYERTPSQRQRALLKANGFLAPLLEKRARGGTARWRAAGRRRDPGGSWVRRG